MFKWVLVMAVIFWVIPWFHRRAESKKQIKVKRQSKPLESSAHKTKEVPFTPEP